MRWVEVSLLFLLLLVGTTVDAINAVECVACEGLLEALKLYLNNTSLPSLVSSLQAACTNHLPANSTERTACLALAAKLARVTSLLKSDEKNFSNKNSR